MNTFLSFIFPGQSKDLIDPNLLVATRGMQILLISCVSMLLCQLTKVLIYSIRHKKAEWFFFISTGGFPSSHSAFCVTMCVTLGLFQWNDLGTLDWSFPVAVIISIIVIHDAMGVRLEASKHAKILNNLAADMTEDEKKDLGYGKNGQLKELLGHKGIEVLGGIAFGFVMGIIGYVIFVGIQ